MGRLVTLAELEGRDFADLYEHAGMGADVAKKAPPRKPPRWVRRLDKKIARARKEAARANKASDLPARPERGPKQPPRPGRPRLRTPSQMGTKHARRGPYRQPGTLPEDDKAMPALWYTTRRRPWVKRAENRAANKRARAARKANR